MRGMKRAGGIAAIGVVLLLAGCSAPTEGSAPGEPAQSSPAPLVAESPAASADESEQAFLDYVRENLPADTVIPDATDEQLLAAGAEACESLAESTDTTNVSLIEGEERNEGGYFYDSSVILTGAATSLCD